MIAKRKLLRGIRITVIALLVAFPVVALTQDADDRVTARSYEVRYRPLADAVDLVSTVLSEDGSVSLTPRLNRLVVQDHIEILDRVGDLLNSFDLPPRSVDVTVSLFMGSDRREEQAGRHSLPPEVYRETREVRETLADWTKWVAFDPLGSRAVTCVEGIPVTVNLSDDYRVRFVIDAVQDGPEDRVTFRTFELLKVIRTADGGERTELLYQTGIVLPTRRELLVGAASGPDSRRALFLKLLADPR